MNITYFQPPDRPSHKWPIGAMQYLKNHCHGRVLNLFAGKWRLNIGEYRVDVSEEFNPNLVCDAFEYVQKANQRFNTVIFFPTRNLLQVYRKHKDGYVGRLNDIKDNLVNILEPNATVISIGHDTVGMGRQRLFIKTEICMICHGFGYFDSMLVIETMI